MIELALWRVRIGHFGCKPSTAVRELKRTKLHGIQSVLHLSMLHKILLIQAGDVELNPGPEIQGLHWIRISIRIFLLLFVLFVFLFGFVFAKMELSFQQVICNLSFRWVNILHSWTVNSVNRLIKNPKHITAITVPLTFTHLHHKHVVKNAKVILLTYITKLMPDKLFVMWMGKG